MNIDSTHRSFVVRLTRTTAQQPWRYVLISAETNTRYICPDIKTLMAKMMTLSESGLATEQNVVTNGQ